MSFVNIYFSLQNIDFQYFITKFCQMFINVKYVVKYRITGVYVRKKS